MREIFGDDVMRYIIVFFIYKEDLEGGFLVDYIYDLENKVLSKLVVACGGRVCVFNNRVKGSDRDD